MRMSSGSILNTIKKDRMNKGIFFSWPERLNRFNGRTPNWKIYIFLIENCSAHDSKEVIPELANVEVNFLPSNKTSRIQLMDARIIAVVKGKFRGRLSFHPFENIHACKRSIYNIDILRSIRWITVEWN